MFEESISQDTASIVRKTSADAARLEPQRLARLFAVKSYSIGLGIVLAGAAYPAVLTSGNVLLTVAQITHPPMIRPSYHSEVDEALSILTLASTLGAGIGLIWATIVCAAILPLVYAVVWSFQVRGNLTRLGAFAGGLVGFVAFLPLLLNSPPRPPGSLMARVLPLIFGPGLTTILGQLGGAWGARRVGWYERAVAQAAVSPEKRLQMQGNDAKELASLPSRFQFGIRHLLWAGIWLSLLLAAIRLIVGSFQVVLPLLIGWLAYQAATMWIGEWLIRVWGWFRQQRQSRST